MHYLRLKETLIEGEHVKAHRTVKERQQMTLHEKFITEGSEKAGELAKEGAMLDEGFFSAGKSKHDPAGERRSVPILAVCSQLSLFGGRKSFKPKSKEKWIFLNKKREAMKHQTEWCVTANKYRCMRCKNLKMPGKWTGPKWLMKDSKHKFRRG